MKRNGSKPYLAQYSPGSSEDSDGESSDGDPSDPVADPLPPPVVVVVSDSVVVSVVVPPVSVLPDPETTVISSVTISSSFLVSPVWSFLECFLPFPPLPLPRRGRFLW